MDAVLAMRPEKGRVLLTCTRRNSLLHEAKKEKECTRKERQRREIKARLVRLRKDCGKISAQDRTGQLSCLESS